MHCVFKPWIFELSYRMQSVVVLSLRGCDTARKDDPSKFVTRALRFLVFNNADPTNTFIVGDGIPDKDMVETFLWDLDSYSLHFVMHTMHAAEIVGYYHPEETIRDWWEGFYKDLAKALHVNPETNNQLDVRLGYTTAEKDMIDMEDMEWDAGTGTSHGGRKREWSGGS